MKNILKVVLVVVLMVVSSVSTFVIMKHHVKPDNRVCLQWVQDPNTGTRYYGWYEGDGSAFNSVGSSSYNHRMGYVEPTTVPVYIWQRVR